MPINPARIGCATGLAILLAGCGGGGGGGGSTPTTVTPATSTFAFDTGYRTRIQSGATDNFDVSGSCVGTARIAAAAAQAANFEGVSGFAASQVSSSNWVCPPSATPSVNSISGSTYFNSAYVPIGLEITGGEYSRFEAPPAAAPGALPASVKVGDSGTLSTSTIYADNTKAVVNGRRVVGYAIEDDTPDTAVANVITRTYSSSGELLVTQQSRYRMPANGKLTLLSIDVQFSTISSVHLIYTPK